MPRIRRLLQSLFTNACFTTTRFVQMTLAPNRLIASIDHIVPDVSLRVDEWLRDVSTKDATRPGSEPSTLSTVTGLSNLSSLHDDWLFQWTPEPGPSDKVQSWLHHGSLAALELVPQRYDSGPAAARFQDTPTTPFTTERAQARTRRSTTNAQFIFPTSVPVPPARPHYYITPQPVVSATSLAVRTLGKGKEPALISSTTTANEKALQTIELGQDAAICGVCQEGFKPSSVPLTAAHSPGSSSQSVRHGLYLHCPRKHGYCLDCLTGYIRVKLEDKEGHAKFPVRCPECPPRTDWEIDDETAGKVLAKDLLENWHSQRLLASIDLFYCPNPKCSEAIEITEDLFPLDRTECPACRSEICYQCRSMWHYGLNCEDANNPLPDEEAFQRLAARNHWRQCPRCGVMVERTEGCNHMTCRCGAEFCFACGANYAGGCTRIGGCNGQWLDTGAARDGQPLRVVRPRRSLIQFDPRVVRPRPLIQMGPPPRPPLVVLHPPPLPRPNPNRHHEPLMVERQRERHQQEFVNAVSRPRKLQRRRQDDELAVSEAERPRRLHRARPPAPVLDPDETPTLEGRRHAINRWWTLPRGSAATRNPRVQRPNQEVSGDAQGPSVAPADEEWVMLSSRTDNVRQTIFIRPPTPANEGAGRPNTRVQETSAAIDARMKPLPPVPSVEIPSRQRRDSDQSRNGHRGAQPLRLPRLSLPGRVHR